MPHRGGWRAVAVLVAVGTCLSAACSSGSAFPPVLDGLGGIDGGFGAQVGACGSPHAGCPCSTPGAKVACGEVVSRDGDYVTCSQGTITCTNGAWGPCLGDATLFMSGSPTSLGGHVQPEDLGLGADGGPGDGGSVACQNDPCDPTCQGFVDNSNGVDGGPGLQATDAGGWTLGQGPCTGLACDVPSCPAGQTTSITGTVYDPAGLEPISNALVMIANGPIQPIPAGVSSDACSGATLPPAVSYTYSAVDGTFTLSPIPIAKNVPLVIQIGRWRKITTIDTSNNKVQCGQPVTALSLTGGSCNGHNNYAGAASCPTRLPRTQSEGNVPQIAIVTGSCDPMECLLYRIGVDRNEFTDEHGTGRVHVFKANGAGINPGANDPQQVLLGYGGNSSLLDAYDLVMLPCQCGSEYGNGQDDPGRSNLVSYAGKGGRVFTSHWGREWIERPTSNIPGGPFPGVANWITDQGGNGTNGTIVTGTSYGNVFDAWMKVVGATTSTTVAINPWREDTSSVTSASRLFVTYAGNGGTTSGAPADFTFDTPLGAQTKTGRVMFTDMHLSVDSSKSGTSSGNMPAECVGQGNALSPQELAGEYLFFELGSCVGAAPLPTYSPATFTRDFKASCPSGFVPAWRFFSWEDTTPSDSNITFTAATADSQGQLGAQFPVAPLVVASGANTCPGGPSCSTNFVAVDVDPKLQAGGTPNSGQPPHASHAWLRVSMTLNPSSNMTAAPTLLAWKQTYDCVPAE